MKEIVSTIIILFIIAIQVVFGQDNPFIVDTSINSHFEDIKVFEKYYDRDVKLTQSFKLNEKGEIVKEYSTDYFFKNKSLTKYNYKRNNIISSFSYYNNSPWDYSKSIYKYNEFDLKDSVLYYLYETYEVNYWDKETDSILNVDGKASFSYVIDTIRNDSLVEYNYNHKKTKKEIEDKHLVKTEKITGWRPTGKTLYYYSNKKISSINSIGETGQRDSIKYFYDKKDSLIKEKHYSKGFKAKNYNFSLSVNYNYYNDSTVAIVVDKYRVVKYVFLVKNNKYTKSEIYYYHCNNSYNKIEDNEFIINENTKIQEKVIHHYKYDELNRIIEIIKEIKEDKIIKTFEYNTKHLTQPKIDFYKYS